MDEDLEAKKRDNDREVDQKQTALRGLRTTQRLRLVWLIASLVAVGFLGWAMLVGVWTHYRGPFTILGLAGSLISTAFAGWQIFKMRPTVASTQYELLVLQTQRLHLAAAEESDPVAALRIYRLSALDDVERYRKLARRNRRYSNLLQWLIIVGSVTATSLTSASTGNAGYQQYFRWSAAGVSALVSMAAALVGYFKFRERGFNQQQTADAIEKHYRGAELRIEEYSEGDEKRVLQLFAQNVEVLKDEQRKRELQLEQSSERGEHQQ
ncbi:DUF4231 domain-containing protein [Actinoallomurus rhizosphaericola]|uniref:DUF4231 domain-containing protein n=1 Tax=Actinoallomurus rhizosphaericola TaxID=2952536 RepID=UPI0020917231|nr:DUF4231 domain-containing protein [Actinoallomurus rhizosphaericola]MCO5992990.1 DUF4231 domain-containing protein [Actinoallomurus rhizosphaericola]